MSQQHAIPVLHEPEGTRTETRAYGDDAMRFGSRQAPPELADDPGIGRHQEDALLQAGLTGAMDSKGMATLCRAYRQIRRELAAERDAHRATQLELDAERLETANLRSQLDRRTIAQAEIDLDALVVDVGLDGDTVRVPVIGGQLATADDLDPGLCRRLAAWDFRAFPEVAAQLTAAADLQAIAMRAVERAVDAALGELARQQGPAHRQLALEARGAGIAAGRTLLVRPCTAADLAESARR